MSDRHGHLLDEWIKHLNKLTWLNFDVCLVDTSINSEEYFNRLKTKKVKKKKLIVFRHIWEHEKRHPIQMLADARNIIRDYFLANDYDYLFWLDDDIFIPKNGIQKLLSANKDCVGFYAHVYYEPDTKPCLLKSGEIIMGKGLDYWTWDEINAYKKFVKKVRKNKLSKKENLLKDFIVQDRWRPNLFKTYGVNLGVLMLKRNVVEAIPFRTHPTFIYGEDLWFFSELNEKHFDMWCDTDVRVIHKNTEWVSLINKCGKKDDMGFWVAMGPAEADKVVFLKRGENETENKL